MRFLTIFVIIFSMAATAQVKADIVYNAGYVSQGNNGSVSSSNILGQTFTNANYSSTINYITMYLAKGTGVGTVSLSIYAVTPYTDGGGHSGYKPTGAALSTSNSIDASTLWTGGYTNQATFTGFTHYELAANTRYAYQLNTSGLTSGQVAFNAGALTNSTTTGQYRFYSSNGGTSYDLTGDYNILSGFVDVTAVPEPTTLVLTGGALAAGAIGAYFNRRRRATQPTTA